MEDLLDSGAFHCEQVWEEGSDREGAERLQIEEAKDRIAYVEEHGKGQYPMDIPVMDVNGVHCANVHIVYYLMKK